MTVQATTVGNTLRVAFADLDPLVAVDAAGAIPYFSHFRSIDMLGLNDAHIARVHDESFGRGVQGHELGDGAYVLSREPDVIVAGVTGSSRLAFRGGKQMEADPRFHAHYRRVRMWGDDPVPVRFNIHARIDGRVGVRRTERTVTVPGYLLASAKGTRASLGESGLLRTEFLAPIEAPLEGLALPAGTWRFRIEGEGSLGLGVRRRSDGRTATPVNDSLRLVLETPDVVDVVVAGEPPALVSALVAELDG